MDRDELLKKLADDTLNHYQAIGLPPFKCQQLVNEGMEEWKKLPVETLRELLDQGKY